MRKRLHWILPTIFTLWMACAFLVLSGYFEKAPLWVTNVFSLTLVPFWMITFLLSPLGLTMGNTAYSGPTDLGFVIGTLLFDLMLFGIGKLLQIRFKKQK